jgi:PAS domain S-box-containing protein
MVNKARNAKKTNGSLKTEQSCLPARSEFEQLAEASTNAIRIINNDFTIRYINQAFGEMAGVDQETVAGKKCWEVFPSSLCHTDECRALRILKGEKKIEVEIERQKHDGTTIPCVVTTNLLRDDDGNTKGIIEQFRDITEKRQLQYQVTETDNRYRALLELGTEAGEAIVMLQDIDGKEGIQIFFNDQWPNLTGYSREELLGTSFFHIIQMEDRQAFIERYRLKMIGGTIAGLFETEVIRKDGKVIDIELTSRYTSYQSKPTNMLYIRDITSRKEKERALQASESLYHTIFESTGTRMCVLDEIGRVLMVNKEWEKFMGITAKDAINKLSVDLFPDRRIFLPDKNVFNKYFQELFDNPDLPQEAQEITTRNKKGDTRYLLFTARLIPGTKQRIVSSIDITKLKRLEKKLKASEVKLRLLSKRIMNAQEQERTLIARELHDSMAQELIAARIDTIAISDKFKGSEILTHTDAIIKRIDGLLDSVHDISASLRPKMLDELGLIGAIQWYIHDFEQRSGTPFRVNLHIATSDDGVARETATAAYRILQEAMLNALRHSKADDVDISVFKKRRRLVISVEDQGIGFNLNKLNDRLSLGLLGMKERAALAGGNLYIKTHPGRGTCVTMSFPLHQNDFSEKRNT